MVALSLMVTLTIEHPLFEDIALHLGERQDGEEQDNRLRRRQPIFSVYFERIEDHNAGGIGCAPGLWYAHDVDVIEGFEGADERQNG